jgi:hypothetical protein
MKKIAVSQSNYIPWKGYFDLIGSVDEFILYDDMQFTKNDWRNRNRIKTPRGVEWLSVPVGQAINRRIRDVTLPAGTWREKHWRTLEANYRRAPAYAEIAARLAPTYLSSTHTHLSAWNRALIETVCSYLGIKTKITNSWDYDLVGGKSERLVNLCQQAGASEYVSAPAARDYLEEDMFRSRDLKVTWMNYDGYPEYPQLWGDFTHQVSIVDLLFNCGERSSDYMKSPVS